MDDHDLVLKAMILGYPLVNVYIAMENHHFSWDNHGKSPFFMGKSPFYSWANPLFLWPFSMGNMAHLGFASPLSSHDEVFMRPATAENLSPRRFSQNS
jgi:hypothetical protein